MPKTPYRRLAPGRRGPLDTSGTDTSECCPTGMLLSTTPMSDLYQFDSSLGPTVHKMIRPVLHHHPPDCLVGRARASTYPSAERMSADRQLSRVEYSINPAQSRIRSRRLRSNRSDTSIPRDHQRRLLEGGGCGVEGTWASLPRSIHRGPTLVVDQRSPLRPSPRRRS
jgi:hypothetical protein